jgi:hypothetical protein
MKALTAVFSISVVGVAACLVMTIFTAVQQHRAEANPPPISIPLPAYGNPSGATR